MTATATAAPRTDTSVSHRSTRSNRLRKQNLKWGLIFCSPAIVGLLVFTVYPVLMSLYYSLTANTMVGDVSRFVGLRNYADLFHDSVFWQSLGNTLYIIVGSVPFGIVVAMVLALLLNMRVKGQSVYRVIFFIPAILPAVGAAVVWSYVFNPQYGVLNTMIGWFGVQGPSWLSSPDWSKPALVIMSLWGVGNLMVIMLAGLQDVPVDLHDQAKVDGATVLSRFRHVTIPFLSPHMLFALVTGLIAGFQYFTQAYVLTGGTGSPANSTLVSSLYLYQNAFTFFKVGYASALAWVLFLLTAVAAVLVFRIAGRRVYYGGR